MGLKISSVQTCAVRQICNFHGNPNCLAFSYYFYTLSSSGLQLLLKAIFECIFCCDMIYNLFSITSHAKGTNPLDSL